VRDVPYGDLRGLLLDLGNTLMGMDATLVASALAAEGVPATRDRFRRAEAAARPALSAWIASPDETDTAVVYLREILARLDVGGDARTELAPRLVARLRSVPTPQLWSAVLPGVPAALARLRATGLRLVVVSNSDGTAEAGLVESGLRPLVDAVVDSAVFGTEKPDRRIFEHALALAGLAPHETAHVGDLHAVDVLGAAGAGIHPVLLDPYGDWPDMGCATVPDLATLAAHIGTASAVKRHRS
jgi:putative hydrolase of the HAD superfamily